MTQTPENRPRRNSDASQHSCGSCATQFSWLGMISQKAGHNGCPISHFLAGDHPWHGISSAEGGVYTRTNDQTGDNSSTMMAEDGRSLQSHPSRLMMSARNSMYSGPSTPGLTSNGTQSSQSVSDLSSTQYNHQMYDIPSDSFGNLNTHRSITARSVAIHPPRDGMYGCLFAFDGCSELRALDTWKVHVDSHLSDADRPASCLCTICGEKFHSGIAEVTWGRFLSHVLYHKYPGEFKPDPAFVEFCLDTGIISEYTSQRLHLSLAVQPPPPPPPERRERERERRARTPRRVVDAPVESRDIAQVEYRASWGEDTAMQRAIERDIVVNRGNSRVQRGHRA